LPALARDLESYLRAHPNNGRALVLRGRILGLQYRFAKFTPTGVTPLAADDDPRFESVRWFDRAVAADPRNAEAHFWKAVTLSEPVIDIEKDSGRYRQPLWDLALSPAREAYRLHPEDARFEAFVRKALIATSNDEEAVRLAGGHGSLEAELVKLMADRDRVPVPPGAVLSPGTRVIGQGPVEGHPEDPSREFTIARTREFTCAQATDSVIAFYHRVWPSLSFLSSGSSDKVEIIGFGRVSLARLRWEGAALVPEDTTATLAPKTWSGLELTIVEFQIAGEKNLQESVPAVLTIVDHRRFHP
jgi:hypothetical protein